MLDFLYHSKRKRTFQTLLLFVISILPMTILSMIIFNKSHNNLKIILLSIFYVCVIIIIFIKIRKKLINKDIVKYVKNELNGNKKKQVYYNENYNRQGIVYSDLSLISDFYIVVYDYNKLQLISVYRDKERRRKNGEYLYWNIEPIVFANFFDFAE